MSSLGAHTHAERQAHKAISPTWPIRLCWPIYALYHSEAHDYSSSPTHSGLYPGLQPAYQFLRSASPPTPEYDCFDNPSPFSPTGA